MMDLEFSSRNENLLIDQQTMEELHDGYSTVSKLFRHIFKQFKSNVYDKIEDDEEVKRLSEHINEKIEDGEEVKTLSEKLIIYEQSMELPDNYSEDLELFLRRWKQCLCKGYQEIENGEEVKKLSEHMYEKIEDGEEVKRSSKNAKNNYFDWADWTEEKSCYRPSSVRINLFHQQIQHEQYENWVDEVKIASGFVKNNRFDCVRAGKKNKLQHWLNLNIPETLSFNRLSGIQSDFQCGFGECPPKPFTWAKIDRHVDITENMSSHLDNNELHLSNRNVPRDPEFEFQHGYNYVDNQHTRKETARRFSSFVVSADVFLGIVYKIWNSQLSIINVPPLHKEHNGHHSIWLSLLGLFGFMVFVSAVAVMILVGAAFTSMQKAMLLFWVILLYLQSANSMSEVYVILVGGLFMGWYAFGKNSHHQIK